MKNIHYIYLILFILAITTPVLQKELHLFKEKPLNGVTHEVKKNILSSETWMDGSFQASFEKWLNAGFGFRGFYVRLYNQFQLSVFDNFGASGIEKTKNNLLYQKGYFNEFIGKDVLPEDKYDTLCFKMACINQLLAAKGKPFLYVIAPGKVAVYHDQISDTLIKYQNRTTNYSLLKENLQQYKVPHIDFQQYFIEFKHESDYPIFPVCGTHWSGYAATLAADSILSFLRLNSPFSLNNYQINEGYTTKNNPIFSDNDLGDLLNLLIPLPNGELYYPRLSYTEAEKPKPKLLILGDSFVQSFWHFNHLFSEVFSDSSMYWYYYRGKEWPGKNYDRRINSLEILQYIEMVDMVVMLTTDINHKMLGFGFVDDLYTALIDSENAYSQLRKSLVERLEFLHRRNPKLMKQAQKDAQENGITLDSALNDIINQSIIDDYENGQLYFNY